MRRYCVSQNTCLELLPSTTRNRRSGDSFIFVPFFWQVQWLDFLSFYFPAAVCCMIAFTILHCRKMTIQYKGVFFMSNYSTSFQGNKVITRRTAFQYAQVNTRIPFYVESIAAEAFQKRGVIQTIQFPSALSHIGARAFWSCNSLKGLSLPENMTEIGSAAFADCSSMRRATIPASVDELPRDLFSENIKLSTVEFHGKDRLQTIHKNAFSAVILWLLWFCRRPLPRSGIELFIAANLWTRSICRKGWRWSATKLFIFVEFRRYSFLIHWKYWIRVPFSSATIWSMSVSCVMCATSENGFSTDVIVWRCWRSVMIRSS